eukprot:4972168-Alexandrium_andersonii.AAC.1
MAPGGLRGAGCAAPAAAPSAGAPRAALCRPREACDVPLEKARSFARLGWGARRISRLAGSRPP